MRIPSPLSRARRAVVGNPVSLLFIVMALAACGDPAGLDRQPPRIVFVREPNFDTLFVSDLGDGTVEQPIVPPLVSPLFRFSPAGDRLATIRAGGALIVMNVDGSDPHQIASSAGALAWSPDGSRIAYVRTSPRDLHFVGTDGTNDTRVPGATPGGYFGLAWSPDGNRIAFDGDRPLDGGTSRGVFIIKLDGTDLRDLDASLPGPEARASGEPTWSPDGRYLAFHRWLKFSPYVVETKLWVMSIETGEARRITSGDGEDVRPDWSPSGDQLVFLRFRSNTSDVFVVRPDGTGLRQLTDTPQREESPSYWARP